MYVVTHFWANLAQHNEIYHAIIIITKNHTKMLHFSSALSVKNCVILCYEIHSLLLTYLKALLEGLFKKEDVYNGIYKPLWCHSGPYNYQVSLPKYQENNRFGG